MDEPKNQAHSLPGDVGMLEAAMAAIEKEIGCYTGHRRSDDDIRFALNTAKTAVRAAIAALTPSALSGDAGETLESIIEWGDQTFGPCSQERAIERAGEEWDEMEEDGADVPIEAADVIICLLRIPGILDAINRKMTINRGRTWDVRPDGTGYHVRAAALATEAE